MLLILSYIFLVEVGKKKKYIQSYNPVIPSDPRRRPLPKPPVHSPEQTENLPSAQKSMPVQDKSPVNTELPKSLPAFPKKPAKLSPTTEHQQSMTNYPKRPTNKFHATPEHGKLTPDNINKPAKSPTTPDNQQYPMSDYPKKPAPAHSKPHQRKPTSPPATASTTDTTGNTEGMSVKERMALLQTNSRSKPIIQPKTDIMSEIRKKQLENQISKPIPKLPVQTSSPTEAQTSKQKVQSPKPKVKGMFVNTIYLSF